MSFILDALRKSEHERQRQVGPGITDIRAAAAARSGLPPWAMILGGLLLINVLVVVALAFRGRSDEGASGAAVSAPTATPPSAPLSTSVTPPVPAMSPANASGATSSAGAMSPGSTTSSAGAASSVPATSPPRAPDVALRAQPAPPPARTSQTPASAEARSTEPGHEPELRPSPKPEPAPRYEAESYASLPTYGDVTLQGASLPELHIDLHVYAAKPADRLVFINTRKYREGGQTPDGTTVERITPDGVVLNHHGVRFLLPRQ